MDIQHDVRQRKFYTVVKGNEVSLEYNDVEPGLWEFHCPNTPAKSKEAARIEKLIEYALYYMKRKQIQLAENGTCDKVRNFVNEKNDLQYLVNRCDL